MYQVFTAVASGYKVANPTFSVEKRTTPTIVYYDAAGNVAKVTTLDASLTPTNNVSASGQDLTFATSFRLYLTSTATGMRFTWTVDAEL